MKNNVQLYVNSQLVDLFDFEDINIVDSIQDVRDVSKIFIPFSRQFTVPASKNNNKIFKRYHNNNITNGFDARFKVSATIAINGVTYKKGKVTLTGVTVKNDMPLNYKLVFHDLTVDLKTILGDKMLSDLNSDTLNKYEFDYSAINIYRGLAYGYNLVGDTLSYTDIPINQIDENPKDLIFPFISSNNHYFYDTDDGVAPVEDGVESRNLYTGSSSENKGINYRDLRGGIKLPVLLNAIEETFSSDGINFVGDFLDSEQFSRLYLYLQKDKGLYESGKSTKFLLSDANFDDGTDILPLDDAYYIGSKNYLYYSFEVNIDLSTENDDYKFKVVDKNSNTTVFEEQAKGSSSFSFNIKPTKENKYPDYDLEFEVSQYDSTTIDFDIKARRRIVAVFDTVQATGNYSYSDSTIVSYRVVDNMPKMKIIDFLTSLFKMFNLTSYIDLDGNINIETLDEYYQKGETINITKFIKNDTIEFKRNNLYSEINYEFEKPSTFAVINSNEFTNDEFGNERIEDVNNDQFLRGLLAFDGGKYDVKVKFEKVMYEKMSNQADDTDTDIGWGWLVDKDSKPTLTKPLLFHARNQSLTTPSSIDFLTQYISEGQTYDILGVEIEVEGYTPIYTPLEQYYRPTNSLTTNLLKRHSLHFGSEFDEFYNSLGGNEVSLFNVYWKNTIESIFAENSRIVTFKANLPTSLINTIKLNDVLVINNKKYRINKLNVNITNGDATLELVTYKEIIPFASFTVDTTEYTVDTDLITTDKTI